MDGSEVVSSLQSFKPKHESVNVNELKGTLQDVEATFQKDTAARRAMRSKLERSASSVRRERSELQNMIDFRVQQAAIEEEKKYLDLNRRVDAMVKSQEKQEEQEVKYDDEEKVVYEGGDDKLLFDKEESEEESKPAPSITVLSDDEDVPPQPSVKVAPAVEKKMTPVEKKVAPVEKESELLVMNKEGKLEKAKPKKSVLDMFQRAKEKKREEEVKKKEEEREKKEEENNEEQDDDETEEQNNLVNNDENTYSPQEQPTAEDYERYKRMMRDEDHRKSNRLFDDEAEESGSDVNPDDDDDDDEKMAVPEGIDIIERPSESV